MLGVILGAVVLYAGRVLADYLNDTTSWDSSFVYYYTGVLSAVGCMVCNFIW